VAHNKTLKFVPALRASTEQLSLGIYKINDAGGTLLSVSPGRTTPAGR
jgi:hypothetical protein